MKELVNMSQAGWWEASTSIASFSVLRHELSGPVEGERRG